MPKALLLGGPEASSSLGRRLQRKGSYQHHAPLSLGSCEQGHDEFLTISFYLEYHVYAHGLCHHQFLAFILITNLKFAPKTSKQVPFSIVQHLLFPLLVLIINLYSPVCPYRTEVVIGSSNQLSHCILAVYQAICSGLTLSAYT